MGDYPDFIKYKAAKFGAPKVWIGSTIVAPAAIEICLDWSMVGHIYALWLYVEGKVGAEGDYFRIWLDGASIFAYTFEKSYELGNYKIWHSLITLCQYDLVNGYFGYIMRPDIEFDEKIKVSYYNSGGTDTSAIVYINYAEIE